MCKCSWQRAVESEISATYWARKIFVIFLWVIFGCREVPASVVCFQRTGRQHYWTWLTQTSCQFTGAEQLLMLTATHTVALRYKYYSWLYFHLRLLLGNYKTVFRLHRVAVGPVRGNGIRQPLICVPVVRSKWCCTSSTLVFSQSYMAACLSYTLQTMMLSNGWPCKKNWLAV